MSERETFPKGEGSAAEKEFVVAVKLEVAEDGDILTAAPTLAVEEKEFLLEWPSPSDRSRKSDSISGLCLVRK